MRRDATIRAAMLRRAAATASLRPDLSTHSFQCSWYRRTSFLMLAKLALGFLEAIMWNNFSRSGLRNMPFSSPGTVRFPMRSRASSKTPSGRSPTTTRAPHFTLAIAGECS